MKNGSEKYDYDTILNLIETGTVWDWEECAAHIADFPEGRDDFLNNFWIQNAVDYGSLECVKWMISKGVELNYTDDEGSSLLQVCIDSSSPQKYEILQLLIDNGADVNYQPHDFGWTPLHLAAARDDRKAIEVLIENGADKRVYSELDDDGTPEDVARRCGNMSATLLIRRLWPGKFRGR